jgi:hypothetical protein
MFTEGISSSVSRAKISPQTTQLLFSRKRRHQLSSIENLKLQKAPEYLSQIRVLTNNYMIFSTTFQSECV